MCQGTEDLLDELDKGSDRGHFFSILLAIGLLLAGVGFFALTALHATGHLFSKQGAVRESPAFLVRMAAL